jgi:group II intron reverse transcriptase/maturase
MLTTTNTHPSQATPFLTDAAACRQVVRERQKMLAGLSRRVGRVFNLAQYLDHTQLRVAGGRLRLGAAAGIDRVTPSGYYQDLDMNVCILIKEVKDKTYQALPARRVSIPKDDGSQRNLGLPSCRDKTLQGGVKDLLEAIFEPQFYTHSYGFRPHRSGKMALQVLLDWLASHNGAWVLEVDLSKFFDNIPHDQLLEVLSEKIGDRVILHLIQSWLKAGVMDGNVLIPSEMGTPQGGVISPLAANVFLDKALDQWMTKTYLPALKGEGLLVRYADDFILAFTDEKECRQAALDVTARLEEFKLSVNQKRTKLTDLRKPTVAAAPVDTAEINFLGYTAYWAPCPETGWKLAARTSEKSLKRFKERITTWLEKCGDLHAGDLTDRINTKLTGHQNYFDVDGNESNTALVENMVRTLCEPWTPYTGNSSVLATSTTAVHAPAPYEDRGVDCQSGMQNAIYMVD